MTSVTDSFIRAIESNLFSSATLIKLYYLINFKFWKPEHIKNLNPDIKIVVPLIKEYFIDLSKSKTKPLIIQTIKKAIRTIPEINSIILTSSEYSFYTGFLIFGCNTSTDIDVACIVRDSDHSFGVAKSLAKSEVDRLQSELVEMGYDISRGTDISEIAIDKLGSVIAISKGSKEIQNMILKTYHLHKQKYPCPIHSLIEVEPFDKIRGLSKFILDNLYDLIDTSIYSKKEISSIRKQTYLSGSNQIIDFAKKITKYIELSKLGSDITISTPNMLSILKSLVMKYIQLILLVEEEYSYSKMELAMHISKYIPDSTEYAKYFLFRGREGIFNKDFIPQLHNHFVRIVNNFLISPIVSNIVLTNIRNVTNLDDRIFNQFIKSPINHTEEFEELWNKLYGNSGLNSLFVSPASKPDELFNIKDKMENYIIGLEDHKRFIFADPRSVQWLNLLSIYSCGTNSKIISDSMESKYNLIRGSIGELIISEHLDFKLLGLPVMTKITIGLIVEHIDNGSRGCCPDLILASGDEIIPVEIKCLKSLTKNRDYYRGISLAKRQCEGTIEIIGQKYSHLINRYLLIILGFSEYKVEHIFFNK